MNRFEQEIMSYVLNEYSSDMSIFEKTHLKKTISKWLKEKHVKSLDDFVSLIKKDAVTIEEFMSSFINSYSDFFRDSLIFHAFKIRLIERYKNNLNTIPLRIWCVGSSKGQEAYSYAILLEEIIRDYNLSIDYHIFATDIMESNIEYAKQGSYTISEVSNLTLRQLNTHFRQYGKRYEVNKNLKRRVHFSLHNVLFSENDYPPESIYGNFDYISINNVLIYYNGDIQKEIADKLLQCIKPGGCIISSPSELDVFASFEESSRKKCTVSYMVQKRGE